MTLVDAVVYLDVLYWPCAHLRLYQSEMSCRVPLSPLCASLPPYAMAPVANDSSTSLWKRGVTRFSSSETPDA